MGLSKPPVWRKVEVPATFTFSQLHSVIQTVFGWENYHLWNFAPRVKGRASRPAFRIETASDEFDDWHTYQRMSPTRTKLDNTFLKYNELIYTYDYGDTWEHLIELKDILVEDREYAVCTGGKGTTPPEDCGGIFGYMELKDAFAEKDEAKMADYREWLGFDDDQSWNPNEFGPQELTKINSALKKIKVRAAKPKESIPCETFESSHTDDADYIPVQDLLSMKTVAELREIATLLSFKFKSGVKKDMMIEIIADRMINHPEYLLESAFYYELKAYLDVINGEMTPEYAEASGLLYEFNRFGLLYTLELSSQGTPALFFQMDMADIMKPLIPAELERRERDGSLLFEKLALGCANIYGYTEMYYLQNYYETVGERAGCKYDENLLTRAFYPILAAMESGQKEKTGLLVSPFADCVGFFPDDEHIDASVIPKEFDFDTILKYGEMPYPAFPGKEAATLRNVIRKYAKPGCDADALLRNIWLKHQDIETIAQPNVFEFLNVDKISIVEEVTAAVADFNNTVPFWKFSGHSSEVMYKRQRFAAGAQKPRISMNPNLRAMGIESFDQLLEMARRGEDLPAMPAQSAPKIGRNDPCPCGSGKKYKHCCGRNK